jgi:hypothetical protein
MFLILTLAAFLQAGAVAPDTVQVAPGPAGQAAPVDGSELRVHLVTMGPGDAIWEKFGHNAIWIHDPAAGRDPAYNWGVFDFDQPRFVARFLRGHMLYAVAAHDVRDMIAHYVNDLNRSITIQELALSPAQKVELKSFLEWNALPENAEYRYDYFRDNCSTRARDAIDRVMGGALRAQLEPASSGTTYRFHTRRLTAPDLQWYALLQIGLGRLGDDPLSRWEESFIPMRLSAHIREVTVAGADGAPVSFVLAEQIVHDAPGRVEPQSPPRSATAFMAVLGLLIAALLWWLGYRSPEREGRRAPGFLVVATAWSLMMGITGAVLLLAWLFTDHIYMSRNATALLASPVSLLLAFALPFARRRPRWRRATVLLAMMVAGLAILGAILIAIPLFGQRAADVVALILPAQLALAWGIRRDANAATEAPTLSADRVSK